MRLETVSDYYGELYRYQSAQLLYEAIRLDVFTFADDPVTSKELSEATGWDEGNLELLLLALSSCGHLSKDGERYRNTEPSSEYLSRASPRCIGEALAFREEMTSLRGIGDRVRHGPRAAPQRRGYDFAALARVAGAEMYATGRVEDFLSSMGSIFPDPSAGLRMLDLGGGSGVLAVEFAALYPNSRSYVFERPDVAAAAEEAVLGSGAQERVSVLSGDFNADDIGSRYDLVVASGVLEFVADLPSFSEKIAAALVDGGHLLLVGGFAESESRPQENVVSWLSGYMDGVRPSLGRERVEEALRAAGLSLVGDVDSGRFRGGLYRRRARADG